MLCDLGWLDNPSSFEAKYGIGYDFATKTPALDIWLIGVSRPFLSDFYQAPHLQATFCKTLISVWQWSRHRMGSFVSPRADFSFGVLSLIPGGTIVSRPLFCPVSAFRLIICFRCKPGWKQYPVPKILFLSSPVRGKKTWLIILPRSRIQFHFLSNGSAETDLILKHAYLWSGIGSSCRRRQKTNKKIETLLLLAYVLWAENRPSKTQGEKVAPQKTIMTQEGQKQRPLRRRRRMEWAIGNGFT